jgi:hypothetical protein
VNNLPVGKTAPPIVADYWYRRVPSTDGDGHDGTVRHIEATTSPVPHQVNLLVFLHGGCHSSTLMPRKGQRPNPTDNCWPIYANIRRLVNEFPSLAVTILVNTHGAIGNSPPLPPAAEADTLAKLFLDYHRLPATLAVVERPFFRIPGADRRRIDTETQNEVNYGLGTPGTFANFGHALLIDQDGMIVKNIDMKRDSMLKIRGLIEALLRRGKTK